MLDGIFGFDVSEWQDKNSTPQQINFYKMKAEGASFCGIRAGRADVVDTDFEYNWTESKKAGLLRFAYWFYDYRLMAVPQARKFNSVIDGDFGDISPVIDLEQIKNTTMPLRHDYLRASKAFLDTVEAVQGEMMIYTNPSLIKHYIGYGNVPTWMTDRKLWIAHYLWKSWYNRKIDNWPIAKTPTFKPWNAWTFWQFSPVGDGLKYGAESLGIDKNFFNGSLEDLKKLAGATDEPTPEVPSAEKLTRLWGAHPELH